MIVSAFGSLAYALKKWRDARRKVELSLWRHIGVNAGFLAVAAQALLFVAFWVWPHIGRNYVLFGQWARWALSSFLVALPCVLAGKGASRWWLLSSSVLLFVICFFIVLSA
jgi:hypothetical protein